MTTVVTSPLLQKSLGLNHGFFTTMGSKNLDAVSLGAKRVMRLQQVHSSDVVTIPPEDWSTAPKADAMVTERPDEALVITTADCGPVLLADTMAGVIGAAHAGWRGALAGVLKNTVSQMCALGARTEQMVAVLGPSIHQDSYQVGPEVAQAFEEAIPGASRYFRPEANTPPEAPKYRFNLPAFTIDHLTALGIPDVGWLAHDTYKDARFSSYRRATHTGEGNAGRQVSVIARILPYCP